MTVPVYLQGNFRYKTDNPVTDVQTIINSIVSEATAVSPAWTNPSAGKIVSPADPVGRQVTIQFTKIGTTELEMTATDPGLRSVTRRAKIAAGGTRVNYFIGQFHMAIEIVAGDTGAGQGLFTNILDLSPEGQNAHNNWLVVGGSLNSSGTDDGQFGTMYWHTIRSAGSYAAFFGGSLLPCGLSSGGGIGFGCPTRTVSGSNLWWPIVACGDTVSNSYLIRGKFQQMLYCSANFLNTGTDISVPIDDSTTGVFRILSFHRTDPHFVYMAVRKA